MVHIRQGGRETVLHPKAFEAERSQKLSESLKYDQYQRYHIETKLAPDIVPYPSRFRVKVKKHRLALLLLKELLHYRGNKEVILSRPCVYGVFSGPVGGFAPREHLCVGCLRCTAEYPEVVQIYHNPARQHLGDSYFTLDYVDAISHEAQTGRIPVKGAGYRGKFGGEGWDGMWTDMSEIVRPTRDGIHGREFISTVVDIGEKPAFLQFDKWGSPIGPTPRVLSIPLPIVFDIPPASAMSETLLTILTEAARETETLAIVPLAAIGKFQLGGRHLVPLVTPEDWDALLKLPFEPWMIELVDQDERQVRSNDFGRSGKNATEARAECSRSIATTSQVRLYDEIRSRFPASLLCLRLSFAPQWQEQLLLYARSGIRVFHLVANYHGRGCDGRFVLELVREAHQTFVDAGCRDEVTLLGSGGIIAAEHVPKAIICGLDAVALDTPLLVALQVKMVGECVDREMSRFLLPDKITVEWGIQRLKNLLASWRDQMLEVLGAMGLREVRRLRGEVGRAMFQKDLEREAFGGIEGYVGN